MTTSLYDLAEQVDGRLDDFAFAERTAKVETALTATQVLPIKRAVQHETQHKKLSAIFVQAYDSNVEFDIFKTLYSPEFNKKIDRFSLKLQGIVGLGKHKIETRLYYQFNL